MEIKHRSFLAVCLLEREMIFHGFAQATQVSIIHTGGHAASQETLLSGLKFGPCEKLINTWKSIF